MSFVTMLRTMRGLELLEVKGNAEGPLTCWAEEAEICPVFGTIIVETTDVDIEGTEHRIRRVEQARERADVSIGCVELEYQRN